MSSFPPTDYREGLATGEDYTPAPDTEGEDDEGHTSRVHNNASPHQEFISKVPSKWHSSIPKEQDHFSRNPNIPAAAMAHNAMLLPESSVPSLRYQELRVVQQAERIRREQSVIIRGPFRLLDVVHKGTVPPAGIAQTPTVQEIQSDNGSHFTATVVQDWAEKEGIQWVFHILYYPQANGIVERTNGLVKRFTETHESGWRLQLNNAMYQLNNRWRGDGCPKMKAFYVSANTIAPKVHTKPGEYPTGFYIRQPGLVKMPQIGTVPMVLTTPKNPYTWEARDYSGKVHRISTWWISPSF
ncbi:endogenous retrovirus group k member 18 pol [Limosa lapponica baueri]|uniref:Endogenous retrovirus group k member 18 pol n=1 Tax=Limosa lapponica baueri TaxID=1758121 RepID=A0A2I0TJJ3_LIMLA|nr:endogenous retrovirus group k member 18 pol [Limosa lapponica baueri]